MSRLKNLIRTGMTVEDLIYALQDEDKTALVVFGCDYGDHQHTEQALPILDVVSMPENRLEESAYSNSGVEIRNTDCDVDDWHDETDGEPDQDEERTIVVLR